MPRKLRWGILGVAKINERLIPAFHKAQNAVLVGIASRSLERAREAATRASIPQAFGSYTELLASPLIDAVYIPLPNTLHAEWTRKAADHGKHVLCEKPLSPTARDAADLVAYCQAKKVQLMDGFMWPHHPRTAQMRHHLDAGVIGKVQRVVGTFTFPLPLDPRNIRLQADTAGGSLLDVGCYPVYGIRWAFGAEPTHAWATATWHHHVDLSLQGVLTFQDGRVASFDCSFAHPFRQWFEIVGETGTMSVPDMWLPREASYTLTRDEGTRHERIVVPGHDQIQCMIENFGQAVLEHKSVRPSPTEAVKSAYVMEALLQSAREHQVVAIRA